MALQKDRSRIHVRGLGNLWLLRKEPSLDTAFYSAGHLKNTTITDTVEQEEIQPETGHVIDRLARSRSVVIETNMEQSSLDEISLTKDAVGKVYAFRYQGLTYTGRYQYFCAEQARIQPGLVLPFAPGERLIPMKIQALGQDLSYDVPEYYTQEANGLLTLDGLQLWISPRNGYNLATAKILDVSGWSRHGDFTGTALWQTPTPPTMPVNFIRYGGTADALNFGNILDDDGSIDMMIEIWMKFPSGGAQEEVLSKKSLVTGNTAGYAVYKNAGNTISFRIGSGAGSVNADTSGTITTTWKHYAVTVDRNGNAQAYLNGAADGSPAAIGGVASGTNALNLYAARDGSAFGQVDVGDIRIYRWPGGGLPLTAATILSQHYTAERALYGV